MKRGGVKETECWEQMKICWAYLRDLEFCRVGLGQISVAEKRVAECLRAFRIVFLSVVDVMSLMVDGRRNYFLGRRELMEESELEADLLTWKKNWWEEEGSRERVV